MATLPLRCEVCGPIAAGKTTFCRAAKIANLRCVEEDYLKNPFLSLFYESPESFSFETEISFLLLHYTQIKQASRDGAAAVICDFSLTLDFAYADVTLGSTRHSLFCDVANELRREIGAPNVLIHLVCAEDVLMERIRARGRSSEQGITQAYLKSISDALERRVEEVSKTVPVLRIDSHKHDFRDGLEGHDFLPTLLEHLK